MYTRNKDSIIQIYSTVSQSDRNTCIVQSVGILVFSKQDTKPFRFVALCMFLLISPSDLEKDRCAY
jgi:hypothetical protein